MFMNFNAAGRVYFSFFLFVRLYFSLVFLSKIDFLGFLPFFWGKNVDVSLFVRLDSVPYFSFRLLYPIVLSVPFFRDSKQRGRDVC